MAEIPKISIKVKNQAWGNDKYTYSDHIDNVYLSEKPPTVTDEQWTAAKEIAKLNVPLSKEAADACFYYLYLGDSIEDIATRLTIPIGLVTHTAITNDWFTKLKQMKSLRAGDKIKKTDAAVIDFLTDALIATTAVYKSQIANVIKNPELADKCQLIPKNWKDYKTMVDLLLQLQLKDPETAAKVNSSGNTINVNVAQLQNTDSNNGSSSSSVIVDVLPGESPEDSVNILRLLSDMKEKNGK